MSHHPAHHLAHHQGYVSHPGPVYAPHARGGHSHSGSRGNQQGFHMQHISGVHHPTRGHPQHPAHGLNHQHVSHQHFSHPHHQSTPQSHHASATHQQHQTGGSHTSHVAGAAALGVGAAAAGTWAGYQYSENNSSIPNVTYQVQNDEYEPRWTDEDWYDNDQTQGPEDRWSEGRIEETQGANEQTPDKTWQDQDGGQEKNDDGCCCCGDSDCCGDCDCDCCGGCSGGKDNDNSCCCC